MKYSKKISAILAAAMLFSSTTGFAVMAEASDADAAITDSGIVSDIDINEVEENADTVELTNESLEAEDITAEEDTAELQAEKVTVTVKQTEGGNVKAINQSAVKEKTVDIKSSVAANDVIDDNEYFRLTAPETMGNTDSDSAGVFDNKDVTSEFIEFRKSSSTNHIVKYEAKESGVLTVYARTGPTKPVVLENADDKSDMHKNYIDAESSEKNVYGQLEFDVEAGKTYNIYNDGGTGRIFGVKFKGVAKDSESNESIEVDAGSQVKIVAEPSEGYVNGKILIGGKEVASGAEHTFTANENTEVSAKFDKHPSIVAAENEFNSITIPAEVTEDLTLPASLSNEMGEISWVSSDPTAISADGKITKAVGKDIAVTLTATTTIGGVSTLRKEFKLTVKGLDLKEEFMNAKFEIPENATENFLVDAEFYGSKIVWTVDSGNEKYITFSSEADANKKLTATVTRPYYVEGDKAVVITAKIDGTDISRTFNTTVTKNENSGEFSTAKLISELIEIKGDDEDDKNIVLTSDIELSATDATYGGKITWVSSNPKVVSSKGVVTRPSGKDVTVRLTAIVEHEGMKASREFTVTVKGKKNSPSGGGGGGGGFVPSTGGAGGVIASYTDYSDIVSNPNINTNVSVPKFTDLQEYGWAVSHINRLVNMGIVNGVGNNKFDPSGLVTREQFAAMLVRAFKFENNTDNAKVFGDVEKGSYYEQPIAILSSMGIVKGQSETKFGVGQSITRQDLAVMAALAAKIDSDKETSEFNDAAEISDYAVDSVVKMKKCGVLSGDENNNFNPKAYATRAEAAKIISVILDYMEQSATK